MKMNKYVEELKAKSVTELNEELVAAKKELFNLRFQNATNQLDNTSRIKEVRKNIARIQTVMTEKARPVSYTHLATMSAWAAEGWAQSGNTWSYYDSNGYKVTNVWKKGADNLWRYLNGNGEMAVNTWVDNTYYMDSNGILVTDKWMKFQESGSSEYKWYYFGSSGKAIMDNWSKINNKWYYFDSNGEMQTGWVLDLSLIHI